MTIQETLAEGTGMLRSSSPLSCVETPALDAALLLAETLRTSREGLIVRAKEQLSEPDRKNFLSLLSRRKSGECIAYILGRKEFRGLEFIVNPNVLVPRPDTETLLEAALEYIDSPRRPDAPPDNEKAEKDKSPSLLDLCTGSGALAISLKKERPSLLAAASDISAAALETAALNARRLLDEQPLNNGTDPLAGKTAVRFIQSDLFKNITGSYNIIVSNPPYIPSGELAALPPEVRGEPAIALDGGADGLDIIRKIISQAPEHLLPDGVLLLEAGPEQMPAIRTLLENHGFAHIKLHKDLAGRDRVISGKAHCA